MAWRSPERRETDVRRHHGAIYPTAIARNVRPPFASVAIRSRMNAISCRAPRRAACYEGGQKREGSRRGRRKDRFGNTRPVRIGKRLEPREIVPAAEKERQKPQEIFRARCYVFPRVARIQRIHT